MEHWGRKHIGLRTLASRVRRQRRPGRFDRLRRIARRRSARVAAGLMAVAVLVGVIIPILQTDKASATTWWSPSWGYRRQITFNNSASAENLVNFPVRVSLTGGTNIDYTKTQNSGQDIRFTDSDGTPLPYEIEKWDETGGTAISDVWVKVPQIDAGSTTDSIWMYYGNASATDGQRPSVVWGTADYASVWHLSETSGAHQDATTNNVDSTTVTVASQGQTTNRKIAGSDDFEQGAGDNIVITGHSVAHQVSNSFTLEAWIRMESWTGSYESIVNKGGGGGNSQYEMGVSGTNNINLRFGGGADNGDGTQNLTTNTNTITTGTFHHVVGVFDDTGDANIMKIYINGVERDTTTGASGSRPTSTANQYIGSNLADNFFDGIIDEVRVSSKARSADWVEATYASENLSMNTFGSEQSGTYNPESAWQYRRKITLNNAGGAALDDFPVRVSLSAGKGNASYANMQAAGQDLRFVDSDGTTLLYHEIEAWNASGTSDVWVRVPQVAAGTVTDYIWMYYGNTYVTDAQQPESVWNDGDFRTVFHMADSTGTTITDSTSSSYDATKVASGRPAATTDGRIGGAQNFSSGTSDYVTVNSVPSDVNLRAGNFTQSFWFKLNADAGVGAACHEFFALSDTASTNDQKTYIDGTCSGNTGKLTFSMYNTAGSTQLAQTTETSWAAGTWYYVSAVYSSTAGMKLYVNGVQNGSNANTQRGATNATTAFLGKLWNNTNYLNGVLDDVRLSSSERSADWVRAEYRSGSDQMATYSAEQSQTATRDSWCNDATGVTCDTTWNFRRRVEIINVPSTDNLANFPALVKLSDASVGSQLNNIDYAKTQDDGDDIRFADPSNNALAIPHEIETWNESGDSFVWVKISQIDMGKNTDYIWMYYGNSSVSSPATQLGNSTHATDVWSNGYKMVQHLEETAACATTFTDSTSTANSGTCSGTPTSTTGLIGNARNFTAASSQYINIDTAADDLDDAGMTLGIWFKTASNFSSSSPNDLQIYDLGEASSSNDFDLTLSSLDGTLTFCGLDGNIIDQCIETLQANWTAGVWYHAVITWEIGVGRKLYVNGKLISTDAVATRGGSPYSTKMNLGSWRATADYFNGVLDEAQLSSVHRSQDWVGAEYNTQLNYMNTFGSEELAPLVAPTLTAITTTGGASTTPTFQLRGADAKDPNWLRYKIEVCTNADCSSILRTIDQSVSQTGWSGQDANSTTAYVASSTLASSTLASHTWQSPALNAGQYYWWRGYSVDDTGATSDASAISPFQTLAAPATPTLVSPVNNATGVVLAPDLRVATTDFNTDNVKYQIEVCDTSTCTDDDGGGPHVGVLRAIDQRSSQTGWTGQNAETQAAYTTSQTLSESQVAVHIYQAPALSPGTQYWWRAYAYDPTGSNLSSSASSIASFTTGPGDNVRIMRGTIIGGSTVIGGP